jgi:uncharacterized protein YggE
MRHLAALAPFALCLAFASPAFAQVAPPPVMPPMPPGTISVEGHGEVSGVPDTALVTSGVTTQGVTAREALDANTAAMAQLIETLKAAGIEARDIQTSGFSVSPNYVYTDARDANGYTLPPKINGYIVSNSVSVRVRKLDTLGTVLDQAVTVGANTISGISFSVADPSALYEKARLAAFADAKTKANLYAGAAELQLGNIITLSEAQSYGQPEPYMMRAAMSEQADAAPVPVQAGELSFAINVSVTWALQPQP